MKKAYLFRYWGAGTDHAGVVANGGHFYGQNISGVVLQQVRKVFREKTADQVRKKFKNLADVTELDSANTLPRDVDESLGFLKKKGVFKQ